MFKIGYFSGQLYILKTSCHNFNLSSLKVGMFVCRCTMLPTLYRPDKGEAIYTDGVGGLYTRTLSLLSNIAINLTKIINVLILCYQ
jgi:hypothetical protein